MLQHRTLKDQTKQLRFNQELITCLQWDKSIILKGEVSIYRFTTVEPRYFEVPREMKKNFEIAGLRNNRGSVKGKGKSKGIRSSFEIAGTSN